MYEFWVNLVEVMSVWGIINIKYELRNKTINLCSGRKGDMKNEVFF